VAFRASGGAPKYVIFQSPQMMVVEPFSRQCEWAG
jgi:hypothetical protein